MCEFYTEFDSITYEFSYLWQSPITVSGKVEVWLIHCIMWLISSILAESYHSVRQGEGVADTLHNVVDFLYIGSPITVSGKVKVQLIHCIMSLISSISQYVRSHVLGQDYSCFAGS